MNNLLDTKTRRLKRVLSMKIKVKGVPFVTSTYCVLRYECLKTPNLIRLKICMQTPDVPFGSKFNYIERWVIGSDTSTSDKVFVKIFTSVESTKKLLFQKRIENRGKSDFRSLRSRWVDLVSTL